MRVNEPSESTAADAQLMKLLWQEAERQPLVPPCIVLICTAATAAAVEWCALFVTRVLGTRATATSSTCIPLHNRHMLACVQLLAV